MSFFNFFSTEKFTGTLNAKVSQRDLYSNVFVENVLTIDSLTINNFLVGEIRGNIYTRSGKQSFQRRFYGGPSKEPYR